MRKVFLLSALFVAFFLLGTMDVFAVGGLGEACLPGNQCSGALVCQQGVCCPPGGVCIGNPLGATTLLDLLNNIINFIFNLAIVVTPLMVIIGGFLFVTGGSEPAKLKQGKDILLWTAIGFGVILLARGLVQVLLSVLTI